VAERDFGVSTNMRFNENMATKHQPTLAVDVFYFQVLYALNMK
jgi:hypothetical protein